MSTHRRFECVCCGCQTLEEKPDGTFQICPVCFWEDDNIQLGDPKLEKGANRVSLEIARQNFERIGVSDARYSANASPSYTDRIQEVIEPSKIARAQLKTSIAG